ncbi:hypothetical protein JCM24511_04719 [Saitozyma sp. JCM 24511]|nr:hypothetical protein JCM24511_04719 [Saitozyma sp. JCM 24511]
MTTAHTNGHANDNGDSNGANQIVLNVAIIGVGEVAMTTHVCAPRRASEMACSRFQLPTLLLCSHMYRTVALVDISKQALEHCSKKFHVPKTYTDVEYHVPHAVQSLKAGKHVFIEKPMAITLGGADEIEAARQESGKLVFVGYMRRYAEAFLRVKEMVKDLPKGSINYIRVRDIIGYNHFFVDQGGNFPVKFSDFPPESAAERQTLGDACLAEALGKKATNALDQRFWMLLNGLATHDISAMRELIGMPQKVLKAARSPDGLFTWVMFQYDGFVAFYEVEYKVLSEKTGIDGVRKFDAHIEVYTKDKRIKVTYDTPYVKGLPITATILSSKPNGDHSEEVIRPTYEDAYTLEYKAMYAAITEGTPVKTTAADAKQDLEIFTMIMDAMEA